MSACPSCSAPVRPGQADCDNCGHPLASPSGSPKKRETEFELYRPASKRKTEFGSASAKSPVVAPDPNDPFAAAVAPEPPAEQRRDPKKRATEIDVAPSAAPPSQAAGWQGHQAPPLDPDDPFAAAVTGDLGEAPVAPGGSRLAPDRPLAGLLITFSNSRNGEVFPLTRGRTILGRDPDDSRDTVIRVADDSVSTEHCTIVAKESGISIRDEMSSNGTKIKSAGDDRFRDIEEERMRLEDGDLLKLGDTVLLLRLLEASRVSEVWPNRGGRS
jgi:pSer/pThr/pTyr-binding forkhead associated (FHA) protein